MNETLDYLQKEYAKQLRNKVDFESWEIKNPDLSYWKYEGERFNKAKFKRTGIMIRQLMIELEGKE